MVSRFRIKRAWAALAWIVLIVGIPMFAEAQCSFNAQVTEPNDERGYGIVVTANGGQSNNASLQLCHYVDCRFDIPPAGVSDGTPVELFYSFECLRAGRYTWTAHGSCIGSPADPTMYDDEWFTDTFEVPERLRRFDVQVLDTTVGNVQINYDIDPTKRDAVIYIPGLPAAQQFVQGSGTVIFTVPPGIYKVTAAWCTDLPGQAIHVVTIEVKGNLAPDVIFNVAPSDRVLIHKYRDDDQYPSPLQTADGQVRVNAVVRTASGTPVAGQRVQFRLIDPPDAGPYAVRAGDARVNDNYDGPGRINGGPVASAVSNAAGAVSVTLAITDFAAGDNYQIEAIASPEFDCSRAPCSKSQVYTAWKRVYVEVNKMFRRGAYLAHAVSPGSRVVEVSDVRTFPTPPFRIRLIHARAVGVTGGDDPFFHDEFAHVTSVAPDPPQRDGTQAGRLILDAARPGLIHGYDEAEEIGQPGQRTRHPYLADAAGVITGVRDADYFLPNGKFVKPAFAEAFVEHVWLTDAGPGDSDLDATQLRLFHDAAIPYEARLDEQNNHETSWLAMKWAQQVVVPAGALGRPAWPNTLPNHQILFAGSSKSGLLGESTVGSGFSTVWLYIAPLGNVAWRRETLVHELAHQWKVNNASLSGGTFDTGGHCDAAHGRTQKMYHRSDLTCVMDASLYGDSNQRQRADGVVAFHYVRTQIGVDSEYLTIRRRLEPIPHNEEARPLP